MPTTQQDFIILPGGVHVWNPEPAYLGAVPDDIIESKSAGYTLHLMESDPGWKRLVTDKMIVMGDVPDQALKVLAVTAEKLNEMLQKEIGGPEQLYIYKIRIFDKRYDFCRYATRCGASNALSLYDPRSMEMALHFGPNADQEEFEQTFAHEFTHAYMDRIYRVTEPLWFAEGMAEYFSLVKWTNRGYKPTGKNWKAAMHLDVDNLIPLSDILRATRNDIYGHNFPLYYAQAWGLVHFLLKKHPEVIEGLLNRKSIDISLLSDEYSAYVRKLMGA